MNKKMILFIIALVVLVFFGVWAKKFLAVDSCLDSGGRWDYEGEVCVEYEKALEVDKCLNYGGQWDYEKGVCRNAVER